MANVLKKFPVLIFFLTIFSSVHGQIISYDFVQPIPPGNGNVLSIPPKLFGEYKAENDNRKIIVKARGIFMESIIFGSVTREQIRENSQYEVRNDHIFGVSDYDSLPCVLEGETYWFGMTKTTELFSFNGDNTLRKWNESQNDYVYVLSYEENGYWLPLVLEFTDKGLIVYSPSFDEVPQAFDFVVDKFTEKRENAPRIHLHVNQSDWEKIDRKTYFSIATRYRK